MTNSPTGRVSCSKPNLQVVKRGSAEAKMIKAAFVRSAPSLKRFHREVHERVGSTIFTVTFVKRTTGEIRVMNCRLGVKSKLKGGERSYDPGAKKLMFVYDMEKEAYRSFPLDSVLRITAKGTTIFESADAAEKLGEIN